VAQGLQQILRGERPVGALVARGLDMPFCEASEGLLADRRIDAVKNVLALAACCRRQRRPRAGLAKFRNQPADLF
jgi:hypothetical protein